MNVTFYSSFAKQNNSTKLPTGGGSSYTCVLKEDCSIINPRISLGGNFNPAGMGYCRIPAFNRYYFVTDWEWIGSAWVASLAVDPMVTYRTEIGNTTAYITRADTDDYNETITDGMYPATTDFSVINTDGSPVFWQDGVANGTFIVGIISSAPDTVGSVTYYTMTPAQFSALKAFIFNENFFQDVMGFPDVEEASELLTSISPELLKTIYNPSQYIVSAMWFPVGISGSSEAIKLGWWTTTATGGRLSSGAVKINMHNGYVTLPTHPQAADRGTYLNYQPYTEHVLHFPPFGSCPLDPAFFDFHSGSAQSVYLQVTLDIITGKASCIVENGNNARIAELHSQVGVPIQLAQVSPDIESTQNAMIVKAAEGAFAGIKSGATGGLPGMINSLKSAVIGAGDGVLSALSQPVAQVINTGLNGSFAGITDIVPTVTSKFYKITDPDDTHRGRPVCKLDKIKNYSGFVQCAEGDIAINATETERNIISAYMTSGFFYE